MQNIPSKAIETGDALLAHEDVREREQEILADIKSKTGFDVDEVIWRSDYLGTGRIGAINYRGSYEGKSAVLKVQGVKPALSEFFMIGEFRKQNKSKTIRPPHIYRHLPWDQDRQYEAFLMESVIGGKVVESGKLLTGAEIAPFFEIYKEYKRNCITKPWLPRPTQDTMDELVKRVKELMKEVKPNSPLRQPGDFDLAMEAVAVLKEVWKDEGLEFVHGHFSVEDLMRQDNEVVLFSNLFWKWKNPFYDLVFGYHWEMYSLGRVAEITLDLVDSQRMMWLTIIRQTADEIRPDRGRVLADAALLERSIAGLLLDGHAYLDEKTQIAKYLIEETRKQLVSLTEALR